MDAGEAVGVVYFNFNKAFENVSDGILTGYPGKYSLGHTLATLRAVFPLQMK